MTLLDCESIDSIYGSVEAVAGAKRNAIDSFLKSMDLDALYNARRPAKRYPARITSYHSRRWYGALPKGP